MSPEDVKCLRICGTHLLRTGFAEALGVGSHTTKLWESMSKAKWSRSPGPSGLVRLAKLARQVDWNRNKCTGVCGREI